MLLCFYLPPPVSFSACVSCADETNVFALQSASRRGLGARSLGRRQQAPRSSAFLRSGVGSSYHSRTDDAFLAGSF